MRFYSADTLTGRLLGRFVPLQWEYTDPLTGSAAGQLTLATLPANKELVVDQTRHLARQVVVEDDAGNLSGGPIHLRPSRDDDTGIVTVPFTDWRGWWYRALVWPNSDGTRRDYFAADVEQMTVLTDLAAIGLDHPAAPLMVVDTPAVSEVTRTRTFRMFTPIGDLFDNLSRAERGPDWWTYLVRAGVTVTPHLAFAYPHRMLRSGIPIAVRHKQGRRGNGRTFQWPSGQERSNAVYGVGSAAPPDQGWAVAEHESITTPATELVWPEVMSLPSGTRSAAEAFEHALARLEAMSTPDGTATVNVDPEDPAVASYAVGDVVRLTVDDGWRTVELPNTRILSRTLRGVGETVEEVTLTLDLGFDPTDLTDAGQAEDDGSG